MKMAKCYPELMSSPSLVSFSDDSSDDGNKLKTSLTSKENPLLSKPDSNIPKVLRKRKPLFNILSPSVRRIRKSAVYRIFGIKNKCELPSSTPINTLTWLNSNSPTSFISNSKCLSPILKNDANIQASPSCNSELYCKADCKSNLRRSKSLENFKAKGKISNVRVLLDNLHRKSKGESLERKLKSNNVFENVTNWQSAVQEKLKIDEHTVTALECINRKSSSDNLSDLAGVESFKTNKNKLNSSRIKLFKETETQTTDSLKAKQDRELSSACSEDNVQHEIVEPVGNSSQVESNNEVVKLEKISLLSETIITISSCDDTVENEEVNEERELPVLQNKSTNTTRVQLHCPELQLTSSESTLKNLNQDETDLNEESNQSESNIDNLISIETVNNNNNFIASKKLPKTRRSPVLTRSKNQSTLKNDSVQIANITSTSQMKLSKSKNTSSKGKKNRNVAHLESNDAINTPSTSTSLNNKRDADPAESSRAKKLKTTKSNVILENIAESNQVLDSSDSTIVYVKRKPKKKFKQLEMAYVMQGRRSGFYRVVANASGEEEEELTQAGRPRRNRRPPPSYIQASYLGVQETNVRSVKLQPSRLTYQEDKSNGVRKKTNRKNAKLSNNSQESVSLTNTPITTSCSTRSNKNNIMTKLRTLKGKNKSNLSTEKLKPIKNVKPNNINQASASCSKEASALEEVSKNPKSRRKGVKETSKIENIPPIEKFNHENDTLECSVLKDSVIRCLPSELSTSLSSSPCKGFDNVQQSYTSCSNVATNDATFEKLKNGTISTADCDIKVFNGNKETKTDSNCMPQTVAPKRITRHMAKQNNVSNAPSNVSSVSVNTSTNENCEEYFFDKPLFDRKDTRDIISIINFENLKVDSMFVSSGYLRLGSSVQLLGQPSTAAIVYKVEEGEVLVDIRNTKQKLTVGKSFVIPTDVQYTLLNTSKKKRLILFFSKISK